MVSTGTAGIPLGARCQYCALWEDTFDKSVDRMNAIIGGDTTREGRAEAEALIVVYSALGTLLASCGLPREAVADFGGVESQAGPQAAFTKSVLGLIDAARAAGKKEAAQETKTA